MIILNRTVPPYCIYLHQVTLWQLSFAKIYSLHYDWKFFLISSSSLYWYTFPRTIFIALSKNDAFTLLSYSAPVAGRLVPSCFVQEKGRMNSKLTRAEKKSSQVGEGKWGKENSLSNCSHSQKNWDYLHLQPQTPPPPPRVRSITPNSFIIIRIKNRLFIN